MKYSEYFVNEDNILKNIDNIVKNVDNIDVDNIDVDNITDTVDSVKDAKTVLDNITTTDGVKQAYTYLEKISGKNGIVTLITSIILYFLGFISKCLSCTPVRIVILLFVTFVTSGYSLYIEAKEKCSEVTIKNNLISLIKYAGLSSGMFAFGYIFLSMIAFAGFAKIFTVIGPGKVILPAIVGVISLAIINNVYLFKKGVDEICETTVTNETEAPETDDS